MAPTLFHVQILPLLSGLVYAADYPGLPTDLTTPVQQRIAFKGPNGMPKYSDATTDNISLT